MSVYLGNTAIGNGNYLGNINIPDNSIFIPTAAAPTYVSGATLIFDFGNTSSYPGSGTSVYDLSGNSNTGTLVNGPTFSSANGGVLDLTNTSSQYITTTFAFGQAFSVQVFFKSKDANFVKDSNFVGARANGGFAYWPQGGGKVILPFMYYGSGGTSTTIVSGAEIDGGTLGVTLTNFNAFSFTTNGTNNQVGYWNTTNVGTDTATNDRTLYTQSPVTQYIGYDTAVGDRFLNGYLMAVLVYPFQLTSTQITQNYNLFSSRF
jgi:hypothetical protein